LFSIHSPSTANDRIPQPASNKNFYTTDIWKILTIGPCYVRSVFVITQMSTSVQYTTEVVALEPAAVTMWAALLVPVYLDTPEMDLPVQVTDVVIHNA